MLVFGFKVACILLLFAHFFQPFMLFSLSLALHVLIPSHLKQKLSKYVKKLVVKLLKDAVSRL